MNADVPSAHFAGEPLTKHVIGIYYEVYNELGVGFCEAVYRRAMCVALNAEGLETLQEVPVEVVFRGIVVGLFRTDLVVRQTLAIELKCSRTIEPVHEAQFLNFLRASDFELGLLFNFGPTPEFKRRIWSNDRKHRR